MDAFEFKALFLPLQSAMQLLAERILDNVEDAEDVVQEVFLLLWKRRDQLTNHPNPQGYAMLTTRTHCLDLLRQRNRRAAHEASLRILSDEAILMEVGEQQDNSVMLHKLLDELPDKQRRIIEMKYLEERSTEEMQRELQMSSANIYTSLSRALKTLKEKINKNSH